MKNDTIEYNILKIDFRGLEESEDAQYVYAVLRRKHRFQSKFITRSILFYDALDESEKMKSIRPALRTMRLMNWVRRTYNIEDKEDLVALLERTSLELRPDPPDYEGMHRKTTLSFNHGASATLVYNKLSAMTKRERMIYIINAAIAYVDHGKDELEFKRMCELFLSDLAREYNHTGSSDVIYELMKDSKAVIDLITPVDLINASVETSLASEIVDYIFAEDYELEENKS